ncbi:Serine/threonine-protein phosphatase 4 regulatory subunit 4 [Thoreauomyces humboldtii]|nr:Serine/threonine-protein phosphatase 4 regulatory subunit 4 [Thoreauomyces humboldtii]
MSDKIDWETVLGFVSESLDTQIKGTDEHKLSNKLYKTDEEIGRYMIDEKLDEIDRTVYLLRNGVSIQKHSVSASLCRLLQERGPETKSRVLPIITSILPNESHDLQILFGRAITQATEQSLLSGLSLAKVTDLALTLIARKVEAVTEVWCETLLAVLHCLPIDLIEKEILPTILVEGGLAQPSAARLWSARVIGVVAPRLLLAQSHPEVFLKALSLCQDTDYEVRACMCKELNGIARAVGHDRAVSDLLPEYLELIMDEECVVREAAIDNIMQLIDFFEPAVKKETVIPVWKRLYQLSDTDLRYFTNFYHSLSTSTYSEDETREMCAFNFPALVKCVMTQPSGFESHRLDIVFEKMGQDANRNVRRRLAAGLHDIAALLGKRSWAYLRTGFLRLFGDPDVEVYQQIHRHLGATLLQFSKDEASHRDTQLDDVLFLILRRERECATYTARHNWRLHQDLLAQFRYFPDVFGLDLLHGHCVPLLFKTLQENVVLPIKLTVISCVVTFLKFAKRTEHRERLYRHMYDLKDSADYHIRQLFVELCDNVLSQYSNRFFRESFFNSLLELVKDPVANVRLKVVPLLPEIRRGLRKAQDSALQARVTDAIGVLIGDEDPDVSAAAKAVPASKGDVMFRGIGDPTFSRSQDAVDVAKEEEEQKMLMLEWETEEAARRRDMDDARHEFVKQMAEKRVTTKKGGTSGTGAAIAKGKTDPAGKSKAGLSTTATRTKTAASSYPSSKSVDPPSSSRTGTAVKPGNTSTSSSRAAGNDRGPPGSPEVHRMSRSASTPGGAAKSESFEQGRLPGLRGPHGSPRPGGSARMPGNSGTTVKSAANASSNHATSSLAPMRRSQELLNHGMHSAGGSTTSGSQGTWSATSSTARGTLGPPKTSAKLSPLPRTAGKDTIDSGSLERRRTAASASISK